MRRIIRPQNFSGMGVERDHHGSAIGRVRVPCRGRDDRLVTEMEAVEDANGKEKGTAEGGEVRNGMERLHE